MAQLFTNAARGELSASILATDTTLTIATGGAAYPVATTGTSAVGTNGLDWFKAVLQSASGFEIVYVRTHTAGSNTFSNVLRGQEGTTALAFGAAAIFGLRITSQDILNLVGHIGSGDTAHAAAVASGTAGFMTGTDKAKLDGIASGATNYTHPVNHPPSIITQDASNRFTTDAEKATWNAKESALTFSTGLSRATNTITVSFGSIAGTACQGNDARLSDARPASDVSAWAKAGTKPTYTYSEVGAQPAGSYEAPLTFSTGLSRSVNTITVSYGTIAGTACQGNDSRLSDARPASDVSAWAKAGTKPTYTASEVGAESPLTFSTGLSRATNTITVTYGSAAGTACQGNDSRLSDTRQVAVTDDTATASTFYPMFTASTSGGSSAKVSSTKFQYNPSTGALTLAGDVTISSDETLKTNWRGLGAGFLAEFAKTKYGIYDRIDTGVTQVGVGAQSLAKSMVNAVLTDAQGKLSVSYGNAALAVCVELANKVLELEARLEKVGA